MSSLRHRSMPRMLPSPISVTSSPLMAMIRWTTYRLCSTHARTTSPISAFVGFSSRTLSSPPMMNGSMLRPSTGSVTQMPSSTSLTASWMILLSFSLESLWSSGIVPQHVGLAGRTGATRAPMPSVGSLSRGCRRPSISSSACRRYSWRGPRKPL